MVVVAFVRLRLWLRKPDVDECAERLDSCANGTEMCINDLGRYHCEPLSADAADAAANQDDAVDQHPATGLCPTGFYYDHLELVCIGQPY